jgi:hypothetical protein
MLFFQMNELTWSISPQPLCLSLRTYEFQNKEPEEIWYYHFGMIVETQHVFDHQNPFQVAYNDEINIAKDQTKFISKILSQDVLSCIQTVLKSVLLNDLIVFINQYIPNIYVYEWMKSARYFSTVDCSTIIGGYCALFQKPTNLTLSDDIQHAIDNIDKSTIVASTFKIEK